jgi:hypothetical protein
MMMCLPNHLLPEKKWQAFEGAHEPPDVGGNRVKRQVCLNP